MSRGEAERESCIGPPSTIREGVFKISHCLGCTPDVGEREETGPQDLVTLSTLFIVLCVQG